jgi:hypothetical protein
MSPGVMATPTVPRGSGWSCLTGPLTRLIITIAVSGVAGAPALICLPAVARREEISSSNCRHPNNVLR